MMATIAQKNMYYMTFLCGKVLRLSVHASTYTVC